MRIIRVKDIENFREAMKDRDRSKHTIEEHVRNVKRLREFLGKRGLNRQRAREFRDSLEGHYKNSSINTMLAGINSFLSFMDWEDCRVKGPRVQRSPYLDANQKLTPEEYKAMVDECVKLGEDRTEKLIQAMANTGARVSELPYFTVEQVSTGKVEVKCKGKSRIISLDEDLVDLLLRFAEKHGIESGPIFITRSGKPVHRSYVWRLMKRLCARLGIDPRKVFPHSLRRLFAREYYAVSKDLVALSALMGHSDVNTTNIYLRGTEQEHRETLKKMNLLVRTP